MRIFHNSIKDKSYLFYRLLRYFVDPVMLVGGVWNYPGYIRDYIKFQAAVWPERLEFGNLYPCLLDRKSTNPFDAQYYYQIYWLFKKLVNKHQHIRKHVDIASKYEISAVLSLLIKTDYVDIRKIPAKLPNLRIVVSDITDLGYASGSQESISCLHVLEHIGLGRYGDKLNPEGTRIACGELKRILKSGGSLYVSVPVGKSRICFNAHRILPADTYLTYFKGLKLKSFSLVDDKGVYWENSDVRSTNQFDFACGLFHFEK